MFLGWLFLGGVGLALWVMYRIVTADPPLPPPPRPDSAFGGLSPTAAGLLGAGLLAGGGWDPEDPTDEAWEERDPDDPDHGAWDDEDPDAPERGAWYEEEANSWDDGGSFGDGGFDGGGFDAGGYDGGGFDGGA